MKDEWWLTAAISDDNLVAELLLRLKDSAAESSPHSVSIMKPLPPSWGLRQPRSSVEKKRETPRCSPTTPFSFGCVGGASPSDGYEDSSGHLEARPLPSDRFRSKISASTGTPTISSKRPRRKKTFAELKEEVSSLLKERTYLKKELATMHLTLKEQRSMNENLKRMKLDLHIESRVKSEANSTEPEEQTTNQSAGASEAASSNVSRQVKSEDALEPDSGSAKRDVVTTQEEPGFALPDLNMMPDEECAQEGIVGIMS